MAYPLAQSGIVKQMEKKKLEYSIMATEQV